MAICISYGMFLGFELGGAHRQLAHVQDKPHPPSLCCLDKVVSCYLFSVLAAIA